MDAAPEVSDLTLSLEPLFLREHGAVVYDVVDSKPVFEQKKAAATKLRESIARLHAERGPDISQLTIENVEDPDVDLASDGGEREQLDDTPAHLKLGGPMPFDDLVKMRDEISFNIHQASVQIAQFQEVAKLLLSEASAPSNEPSSPPITVSVSTMAPSEQKISIRSTNVRVTLGVKDSSVEAATTVLSRASSDISSFAARNQLRWEQAMRARQAHWSMLPHHQPSAPQQSPFFRRDESSIPRNFLMSFSLEESPPQFRRHTLVSFKDQAQSENDDILIFPSHPRRRLRIGLLRHLPAGEEVLATKIIDLDDSSHQQSLAIERRLRIGQREVVGEEIFSLLVQEAATFPSAASFISERRISTVATKETSLTFELVAADDESSNVVRTGSESEDSVLCSLILHLLILLLLRIHRTRRLLTHAKSGVAHDRPMRIDDLAYTSQFNSALRTATGVPVTPILAPIVSLLQYRAFCSSMYADLSKIASGLKATGISCELMFTPVGETSQEAITMLERVDGSTRSADESVGGPNGDGGDVGLQLSGEALLWVDNSHAIRMTFSSPTTLTLHLPHATLAITSLNILRTFITSEVTLAVLMRLQEEGTRIFVSGRWALDRLDPACIGTWDERNASLRWTVGFDEQLRMQCTVSSEVTRSNGAIIRQVQHYDCIRGASVADGTSGDSAPKKLLEWFKASTRKLLGHSQKV